MCVGGEAVMIFCNSSLLTKSPGSFIARGQWDFWHKPTEPHLHLPRRMIVVVSW